MATSRPRATIRYLKDQIITESDIIALEENGFHTIKSITLTSKKFLQNIREFRQDEKVNRLIGNAFKLVQQDFEFESVQSMITTKPEAEFITTGCQGIDQILSGGIEIGSVTQVYGSYRSGKTQLCFTLAITCQLPRKDGLFGGKCIYIDTEGDFRSSRLIDIARNYNMDIKKSLDNIQYVYAPTTDRQTKYLFDAMDSFLSKDKYSLLIVDSIIANYRSEYEENEMFERRKKLGHYVSILKRIAREYKIAVLFTNQVTAYGPEEVNPLGGKVVADVSTNTFHMFETQDKRVFKIISSPYLSDNSANFLIKEKGISDL